MHAYTKTNIAPENACKQCETFPVFCGAMLVFAYASLGKWQLTLEESPKDPAAPATSSRKTHDFVMACPLQKSWFFEPTKRLQPHENVMMRFHVMQCLFGWVFMCVYAVAEHAMLYSLNRTHFTEHNNVTFCHPYSIAITLGCQTSLHHKPDESNTSQMKGQARPGNLLSAMSFFVTEITWNLLRKMIKHFIKHVTHSASVRILGRQNTCQNH